MIPNAVAVLRWTPPEPTPSVASVTSSDPDFPLRPALAAAAEATGAVFDLIKAWYRLGPSWSVDLRSIDADQQSFADPAAVAAFCLRNLQQLRRHTRPATTAPPAAIVALLSELQGALTHIHLEQAATRSEADGRTLEHLERLLRLAAVEITKPRT